MLASYKNWLHIRTGGYHITMFLLHEVKADSTQYKYIITQYNECYKHIDHIDDILRPVGII